MVLGSGLFVAPISNDGKVLREEWEPAYVNDEFTQAEFDRITQVLTC